jgi:hypothetical protein
MCCKMAETDCYDEAYCVARQALCGDFTVDMLSSRRAKSMAELDGQLETDSCACDVVQQR